MKRRGSRKVVFPNLGQHRKGKEAWATLATPRIVPRASAMLPLGRLKGGWRPVSIPARTAKMARVTLSSHLEDLTPFLGLRE
jgi:hypothetical protein